MRKERLPYCQLKQQPQQKKQGQQDADLLDESIDHAKVAHIKKQLINGQLQINPERLAKKILETERKLFPDKDRSCDH
ncbi:MAG: flagellar biosynthesis anti-sigma factor FlgM [Endozoicomonas sp. (ex Botrylloides leachii)]|nr:flagellar biosynthesis anti-sigma factor FlgM [Endozoicomonas sp. (ex Botrylloides leachii)]